MRVELSPKTIEAIRELAHECGALIEVVSELVEQQKQMAILLDADLSRVGVEPFVESEISEEPFPWPPTPVEAAERLAAALAKTPPKPEPKPQYPTGFKTHPPHVMTMNESNDRIRESPFTRAPRSVQVDWLREQVLYDGDWHAAMLIAREYANDERHFRYLRSAIGSRLREMHEEGIVERRDSQVRGSMFEYRLKP